MIRAFFVDFLLPLLFFLLARSFLRGLLPTNRRRPDTGRAQQSATPVPSAGELKRDPVCGTYVSTVGSVSKTIQGHVVYFCSTECRDKFQG